MRRQYRRAFLTAVLVFSLLRAPWALADVRTMDDGVLFDPAYYGAANPDVTAALGTADEWLYFHYANWGYGEGRLPYEAAVREELPAPAPRPEPGTAAEEKKPAVDPGRPMVALTFDDGPSAYDARILSALEDSGARATFFMVGCMVPYYPGTVRRMVADGMEIGNHSYSHRVLSNLSREDVAAEITSTNEALAAAAGVRATVFRAPYGSTGGQVRETAAELGYGTVFWSIDTEDWKVRNTQKVADAVLGSVRDGDIVLMHSTMGTTAAAVQILVPELIRRGYQLVTVSELAQARGGMAPGGNYSAFRRR